MTQNLYDYLEIPTDSSEEDIKKAYRKLSLQYHPDRNSSLEAIDKIRKINHAYEVLGDKESRRVYNTQFFRGGFTSNMNFPNQQQPVHFSQVPNDINNILNMFFNKGFGQQNFQNCVLQPTPILHTVKLTLEQSYKGCTVCIQIDRNVTIGQSVSYESEMFQISIPAGSKEEKFAIKEKGNIYENCKSDVIITIEVENNPPFSRCGNDIICSKMLTLKESLCGFSFKETHPSGEIIEFEERSICKPGSKKVIPGLGMPQNNQQPGDLVIQFSVDFPESLTHEQIEKLSSVL